MGLAQAKMTKGVRVDIDMVTGEVTFDCDEDVSYFEAIGLLEFGKVLLTKDYIGDD